MTIFRVFQVSILIFVAACHSHIHSHSFSEQEKNIIVPIVVEQAFRAKYSDVPHTWERTHYGYEAVFIEDGTEYEAEFSVTGEWLETEYLVSKEKFPSTVLEKIKKEYPNFIITKYEIEITSKGLFYEADITDGEREYEVYFDFQGNPIVDLYED
ncbi:PepSY-like domain-containing protein [Calothrix sp. PCC 6303]|uniref:PepSY-like domain-containing protein n=1 Tax=Calothrix sp. PCC 6303 TaxID=1170562 RepID=UPI0002A019C7|nr:PepSY-like domain-containing protein [Calothrix sp. PCC 6303]AFZ01804.1 hypothetical protein Cal6303_2844 [Calothrix sp. PCC 6303]